MIHVGDMVKLSPKLKRGLDDFYGIVIKVHNSFYNPKVIYYRVAWINTGDSYDYEINEIEKME